MCRLCPVSYLEGSDSAQEPPGHIFSPWRLVPSQSGWSWGDTTVGSPWKEAPAPRRRSPTRRPSPLRRSRDRDYNPGRGRGRGPLPTPRCHLALRLPKPGRSWTAGPSHASVPRVTVSSRPRGAPHISRAKARARQRRKEGGRPPTRRPGSARRSRAPAGPGPPAHFAAPVPPPLAAARRAACGAGTVAPPRPHAAPPGSGNWPGASRALRAVDRGRNAQPQFWPGLGALQPRERGARDFILSDSDESKHVIKQ